MPKGVAILGATGSIGRSALSVLEQHQDRFSPVALTANRRRDHLEDLVKQWHPRLAVLADAEPVTDLTDGTRWLTGRDGLLEAVMSPDVEVVLNAMVGAAGLEFTLAALEAGKRVALANKESLVCGGPLVLEAAKRGGGELVPIDSEHSAILQCLQDCPISDVQRLILTASGGPFRDATVERLADVVAADALRHPTWAMGAKITIDSATLANKALEVIEAHFLFGIGYERIDAVVHPQSIIHSMVEFTDGSVLAQMGFPTMEIPILYALSYPDRLPYRCERFDPVRAGTLTFEAIRTEAFPAFGLGIESGHRGGTYPAVFNAANEIAVAAFLDGGTDFPGIAATIDHALQSCGGPTIDSVEAVMEADRQARESARTFIAKHAFC